MTSTLPGADIRGFYASLGIQLPGWANGNAYIRCFADPDAHTNADRKPSMSVNLTTGAWKCHGCGAKGGAYEAALIHNHAERAAMDLLIRYGIAERRQSTTATSGLDRRQPRALALAADQGAEDDRTFTTTNAAVRRYHRQLTQRPAVIEQLGVTRGWSPSAIDELELGYDRGRITIPIRDANGALQGLLRYKPGAANDQKMRSALGTRLALIPHPAAEPAERILLVEGPPDMIAARSHGLPAIAVPGDHAWKPAWVRDLTGRHITIIMDCDPPGRAAAHRIAANLANYATTKILDLDPTRTDGYDLTDWITDTESPPTERREAIEAVAARTPKGA
jgi:DNA primase